MAYPVDKEVSPATYEKAYPALESSPKKRKNKNNANANAADKTARVANEITQKATQSTTWDRIPDVKELQTKNEELTTRNEQLAAKIEELTKELSGIQSENKALADKLSTSEDKANLLELQIDGLQESQSSLTDSTIASTQVKKNIGALQVGLTELSREIEAEIKNVNNILTGKESETTPLIETLFAKLEKFEYMQTMYQTEYGQSEANFRHAIDQRNSMSNHWNLDRILLSTSDQGTKYLSLFDKYYHLMLNLNSDIKQLQFCYEKIVKNDYRNEDEFTTLTSSVSEKITIPEERINEAKAKYKKLEETRKKELLQNDHSQLMATFIEIKSTKARLEITNENKQSDIKALFDTIETEIKKSNSGLPTDALQPFEIYRKSVEDNLKETLSKNAKQQNELYINLRKWASPTWNETLNSLKTLETELQLLGDRELIHEIQHSHNAISVIKGSSKMSVDELPELTTLYSNETPDLRLAHVKYYETIDSYDKSIASLTLKIADVKGEKALKQDLEEYSVNEFTTKEIVTAQLIKTLTQQKDLISNQKKTIEQKWSSLLLRLYDTANDLQAIKARGIFSVDYLVGAYRGTNPYIGIHTELSNRPVKAKSESTSTAAVNN
jgi:hypothetical protein